MTRYFSLILFLSLVIVGCNKDSDDGMSDNPTPNLNDTIEPCPFLDERMCEEGYMNNYFLGVDSISEGFENYNTRILLESFTGFRSSNAVPANELVQELYDQNSNRLSVSSVHCTAVFGAPLTSDTLNPFHTDYRTPEGEEFVSYYALPSLPNGTINRLEFDSFQSWEEKVNTLLSENNPEVFISIEDIVLNDSTQQIEATIYARPLISTDEDYMINMSICESNIIEAQKDNNTSGGVIYDYTHNHVFRGSAHGAWGIEAFEGDLLLRANEVLSFKISMDINPVWNLENCELLIFISKSSNREVVQVEESPVF